MKNLYVSGFDSKFLLQPLCQLEDENKIEIKEWLVGTTTSVTHKNTIWWWNVVFSENFKSRPPLSDQEMSYFLPLMTHFEQQMVREKLFELSPHSELQNVIFKFIYYFRSRLEELEIDAVVFSDVPHGAFEFILYHVAKLLQIETVFLMPSYWQKCTFIYKDISEIGRFTTTSDKEMSIERTFKKHLSYMVKPKKSERLKSKLMKLIDIQSWWKQKQRTIRRHKMYHRYIPMSLVLSLRRKLKRTYEQILYKNNYKKYFNENITVGEKFVYFPLHLQPEMTTDTLGGVYYDQLFAIEKLRNILPNDWKIYVKENPKQEAYMRGPHFFNRLRDIENVRLLSKDVSTYKIMESCEFVATITGTAGWEAITGGKKALIFGETWYQKLPGVAKYYDGITIKAILDGEINHKHLCNCAYCLRATAHDFLCAQAQIKDTPNFNQAENSRKLAMALEQVLANS